VSDAEAAEEEAERVRALVAVEPEHVDPDDQRLHDEVEQARDDGRRPEQRIADEQADAGEDAPRLFGLLGPTAGADDDEDGDEREDVRAGVDHEHRGGARRRDHEAGRHRPDDLRGLVPGAEDGVRLGNLALVVPDHLGDHDARGREVRPGEAADGERGRDQGTRDRPSRRGRG
jgi:hypothetical protein